MFYARLDTGLAQCPCLDTHNVLGNFNSATGTETAGYELCVGPHGFDTRNTNRSLHLNFSNSEG